MDLTGTMKVWFQEARKRIGEIIDSIKEKYVNNDIQIRVSLVGYSDYDGDGKSKIVYKNFSTVDCKKESKNSNLTLFFVIVMLKFMDKVLKYKFSGDDVQEDVLGGLAKVLDLDWQGQTRILIHIADDPAHNREFHDLPGDRYEYGVDPSGRGPEDLFVILHTLCNKDIEYHFFHLDEHTDKMEARFDEELRKYGGKLIVHQIGDNPSDFLPIVLKAISDSRTRSFMRG